MEGEGKSSKYLEAGKIMDQKVHNKSGDPGLALWDDESGSFFGGWVGKFLPPTGVSHLDGTVDAVTVGTVERV